MTGLQALQPAAEGEGGGGKTAARGRADAYLLGCAPGERRRVQQMVQLGVNGTEVGIGEDTLYEVIVTPFLLDHSSCLLGQHPDFFMAILGRQ